MITNQDLDIANYHKSRNWDDDSEVLIYLRADVKDRDCTYAIGGNPLLITQYLLEMDGMEDMILSAAAAIVKKESIDFQEVLDGIEFGKEDNGRTTGGRGKKNKK